MRGGVLLAWLLACAACGDDAGSTGGDAGAQRDLGFASDGSEPDAGEDGGVHNTCAAPELQHPPCCWEVSNGDREQIELAARGVSFVEPEALANEVFRTVLQQGLDRADSGLLDVMLLVRATPAGGAGSYRTEVGFGCRDAFGEPFRFATAGACGSDDARWAPIELEGHLDGEAFSTSIGERALVLPIPNAGPPAPELVFHAPRLSATLTEERSCVGTRIAGGRWSYGDPPSRVVAFVDLEEARAIAIPSLSGQTFCQLIAGAPCDRPRSEWPTPPDARCDGETCLPRCDDEACAAPRCEPVSDDPTAGCNAWKLVVAAAAAGVEIE